MALCPCHDDSNPSLSISDGKDGRVLVHCFADCPTQDVLAVVGLTMNDLMPGADDRSRIVATYDYRDENGELVYQAVRYEPKGFRQRTPDGNGRWVWSTKGVRRVLYRLCELLANDPDETVYVVEGEKDADRLASEGLVATTNVGGAGKWNDEYSESLRSRHVAILPDNDDPGRAHSLQVAESLDGLAASVKIVELPDLPTKGDVSDWLDAGGSPEQLIALVRNAPLYEPARQRDNGTGEALGSGPTGQRVTQRDEPLSRCPVDPLSGPVAPFPVEVFPAVLQRFIATTAEALPCPPDFPGAMLLPVLSALIGRKRCVELKPGWTERALLWVACVARSGDRKTPAFERVTAPLRAIQRRLYDEFVKKKEEYRNSTPEEKAKSSPPRLQQILTTDTTTEALKDILAENPNGIIYPADELSGWVRSMSQYKGGRGDDRQNWLSIWSGTQIVSNRRTQPEPIVINEPFVSVTGGIQPDTLGDLVDESREDGFAARVLFAYPDPVPPKGWTEEVVREEVQYTALCEALWNLLASDEPVRIAPLAKPLWVEWVNAHRQESPPDNLRPTWSKAEGHCARLALILYLARIACRELRSKAIDEKSVAGAVKLIEYFKSHARRVFGCVTDQRDQGRVGNALRWIRKHGGVVTARKAQMYGLCKSPTEAKQLLSDLAELGHGDCQALPRGSFEFRLNDLTRPNA